MRKSVLFCLSAIAAISLAGDAQAMLITRNVGLDLNLGVNASLLSGVVITNIDGGDATDSITIDLDVLKAGAAFDVGFTVTGTGGTDNAVYKVTVLTRNSVTPFNTAAGFAMNGFDVDVTNAVTQPFAAIDIPPSGAAPTSTHFGFSANPIVGSSTLRFGGVLGGGGELYNGSTATNTFDLATSDIGGASSKGFALTFIANPEPASLLLGGLAMMTGGLAARRRRKTAADVVA